MKAGKQTTLCDEASVSGIGVHSGSPVTLTLHPADAGTGIVFLRTGLPGRADCEIRADVRAVTATEFATVLGDGDGPLCATAEHVLAALAGLGVDNAVVEVDGPEVPIMDGSAEAFVAAIDHAGVRSLEAPRRFLKVLKPVRVTQGRSVAEILPNSRGLRLEIDIEFDHPLIGRQRCALDVSPTNFRRELARARTFGFMRDVAKLWNQGYALGASFENTLVVSETRVLNADGLRYPDEFVRHKAMDAVGDLALAGLPLLATYRSVRGGHTLNHAILSALMADPTAWAVVEATAPVVAPPRRVRGHAEVATPAPAYAPDVS
ncbi:MAG: UDP-3-O-acyl-N-acetylglucosamine deacetylase [Xanthobacteraceae bacterium]|nr:UDP-3-O-acyl-N-acetylglucosamine deacetylase [Xanthobacteraceae bacterium]MBV9627457.1 UDP-3-O-acyl-N-acetylglucosamine deacetylase [Xanthobacteraceae bacterium]